MHQKRAVADMDKSAIEIAKALARPWLRDLDSNHD